MFELNIVVVCWVDAGSFVDDNIIFRWIAYTWFLCYVVEYNRFS